MVRRLTAACAGALLIAWGALPAAAAEEHGITCALSGAATIKPGLNMTDQKYDVAFGGELTDCLASGGETSGKVKAKAVAEGTCAYATSQGTATVKWNNGKKTSVKFETQDVGALVVLRAEVTKSTSESLQKGDDVFGLLVFQADPADCGTEDGVPKATFDGQIGGGSPQ